MERYEEAKEAYKKALELEPNNEQVKQALQEVTELAKAEKRYYGTLQIFLFINHSFRH
jgi:tetratricopeptide (TPR) repeat protein